MLDDYHLYTQNPETSPWIHFANDQHDSGLALKSIISMSNKDHANVLFRL